MLANLRHFWVRLLRFGFHLLYNQFAWSYDAVSWFVSFGAWRDWQLVALPYVRGPYVLEIAHGPGHMLLALQNAGYQTTGIDLSTQMGALSRRRLRKAGADVLLLRGEVQNLPFRSELFDSVLVTFPTDFLAAEDTIAGVFKVLKPNGRFIIVPEARFTTHRMPERIIEWLYFITGQRSQDHNSITTSSRLPHIARWDSLTQQFLAAGFLLDIRTIDLERSQVTVLLAQKGKVPVLTA